MEYLSPKRGFGRALGAPITSAYSSPGSEQSLLSTVRK